jgi:hypothetical protein
MIFPGVHSRHSCIAEHTVYVRAWPDAAPSQHTQKPESQNSFEPFEFRQQSFEEKRQDWSRKQPYYPPHLLFPYCDPH